MMNRLTQTMKKHRESTALVNALRGCKQGAMMFSGPVYTGAKTLKTDASQAVLPQQFRYENFDIENDVKKYSKISNANTQTALSLAAYNSHIPAAYTSPELRERSANFADRNYGLNGWCIQHCDSDLQVITLNEMREMRDAYHAALADGFPDD